LKSRKWRLYESPKLRAVRDPATGKVPSFKSLMEARRWWLELHPHDAPPNEAERCARCGGYFGPTTGLTIYAGRSYHPSHSPQALERSRYG
jgi:hypothetical protein